MANATGIRRSDEPVRAGHGLAEVSGAAACGRERGEQLIATAALGASFVSMQAFEWTKLIVHEGVRPWGNPMGAPQFGSAFFMRICIRRTC